MTDRLGPRAIAYDLVQDWALVWPATPRNARGDLADRIALAIEADRANMTNPMRTDGGKRQQTAFRLPVVDEVQVGSRRADGADRVVGDSDRLKIASRARPERREPSSPSTTDRPFWCPPDPQVFHRPADAAREAGRCRPAGPCSAQRGGNVVSELQPQTCWHCDFFGCGQRGMDRCPRCDGTGSVFIVGGATYPHTRDGFDRATDARCQAMARTADALAAREENQP